MIPSFFLSIIYHSLMEIESQTSRTHPQAKLSFERVMLQANNVAIFIATIELFQTTNSI